MFIDGLAVPVHNLDDRCRFVEFPHVGNGTIGTGHFKGRDAVGEAAQGHG